MAKDIRECLLAQARKFHQWQEITYPGKTTEEIGGAWEVDYPAWNDIFDAFCHVLTQMNAEMADSVLLDEMVYLIARANEAEGFIQETTSHPQWFECLCRRAAASNENEAKWQFAAYLPECSCSQKVRDIILDFAKDPNEYVSRRALLAMPALRPDCVEQFAPLFWERNCYSPELQEYQRIAVLISLDAIHSDQLPQYLEWAKQDGQSYLLEHAKRIEGGLSMNEKLSRPQFNQMDTTEKQALMESLAARYTMTFLGLHTFDHWGQSCTTGIFEKDGREFVFVPGDTVTLGWEQFAEGLNQERREELDYLFQEWEMEPQNPEEMIRESMAPVRQAVIGPMLVGRELEELCWEPVKMDDPRLTAHPDWLKEFRDFAWSDSSSLTLHQSARIERTEDGFHTWIYHCTDYDALLAGLEKQGLSLPTADEWAYLCGGGCRTLFPWGDGLDYSMRLRWFEDMDEDENRPYDMEEPNFFGLSIAYDPYMREVVQADRLTTCGGDGGCNICGGLGPFLGFLPCSPHCKPEVQEDNALNGNYDFYRPIVRIPLEKKGEIEMPATQWLNKYESIKDKLACKTDLDAHFTEKVIGNREVDVLDIGAVHFPSGTIFACDPLVELEDTPPFIQTIPAGTYPVKICVVPSEKYGDRYACVKVEVSREKPVRYELGMTGKEDLDEELDEDGYFGFGVDAGMGCVADIQTQAAFKTYWAKRLEEDPDIDPYNDLFCDLLEENAKACPKYQLSHGDWLNWTVPDTDCNLPIFASGWGDGYYPVYFGYDAKGKVCAVYVRFIDIEASYQEQA